MSMATFVVHYTQRAVDPTGFSSLTRLGSETLDGLSEALLPGLSPNFKVFCTKSFETTADNQWFVEQLITTPSTPTAPLTFEVILEKPYAASPVEYLSQTL